jgi:hypothetical protein
MIKSSIPQEDITIENINFPSNSASKYIKQKMTEMKGKRKFKNNN